MTWRMDCLLSGRDTGAAHTGFVTHTDACWAAGLALNGNAPLPGEMPGARVVQEVSP